MSYAFMYQYLCVNLMKRARERRGPWSDLEYELAGRDRKLEEYLNLLRFVFEEEDTDDLEKRSSR